MLLTHPKPGPSLSDRFGAIVHGLRRAVADQGGKRPEWGPMVAFLWGYLNRAIARFERIARQPRAARPGASADMHPAPPRTRARRPSPPIRLSRQRGWLGQLGHDVRAAGSQLQALLADPELAALLADDPRMARLLRPLCRMLDVADLPDVLGPALRKRAPRPAKHSEQPSQPGQPQPGQPWHPNPLGSPQPTESGWPSPRLMRWSRNTRTGECEPYHF